MDELGAIAMAAANQAKHRRIAAKEQRSTFRKERVILARAIEATSGTWGGVVDGIPLQVQRHFRT
jgi:hypothetical protein